MTILNKQDWDKLDDILGKMDFGGYYDCLEYMKDALKDLALAIGIKTKKLEDIKELDVLLHVIRKSIYKAIDKIKELEREK